MMRTRWRGAVGLATMVAIVATVAACGGDDEDTTSAAATTAAAAATTEAPATSAAATEAASTEAASTEAAATEAASTEAESTEAASTETATPCAAKIAIMGPFTGDAASIGQEQLNWGKYAIKTFNEANGTQIELVEGDTQLDPAQATTVGQKFVSDTSIVGIVGPAGSQEVEAVGKDFATANLAFISPSATRISLTGGDYPTFFRVVPNDSAQGPTVATYIATTLGKKNVLIIDDQTSYSTGLADSAKAALTEAGATVTTDSVPQKQTDFSTLVTKIGDDVEVVFLPWQIAANAQLFADQLAEQGKSAIIFGSDGLYSPKDFKADGSYVSSFAPDVRGVESSKDIVAGYVAAYDDTFGTFGPPVYAATWILAQAVQASCASGSATREDVLAALPTTTTESSILGGTLAFDDAHDVKDAKFYVFKISGGTYELQP